MAPRGPARCDQSVLLNYYVFISLVLLSPQLGRTPGESRYKIPHVDPVPVVQKYLRPRCGVGLGTMEGSVARSTITASLKCSSPSQEPWVVTEVRTQESGGKRQGNGERVAMAYYLWHQLPLNERQGFGLDTRQSLDSGMLHSTSQFPPWDL